MRVPGPTDAEKIAKAAEGLTKRLETPMPRGGKVSFLMDEGPKILPVVKEVLGKEAGNMLGLLEDIEKDQWRGELRGPLLRIDFSLAPERLYESKRQSRIRYEEDLIRKARVLGLVGERSVRGSLYGFNSVFYLTDIGEAVLYAHQESQRPLSSKYGLATAYDKLVRSSNPVLESTPDPETMVITVSMGDRPFPTRFPRSSFLEVNTPQQIEEIAGNLTPLEKTISTGISGMMNGNIFMKDLLDGLLKSESKPTEADVRLALEGLEKRGLISWHREEPEWIGHTLRGMDVALVSRGIPPFYTIQ